MFSTQQKTAPSHKAQIMQKWMTKNFHDHITPNIWPMSSLDFNPLDYYVWIVVERKVNEHPHNTKNSLKAAIVRIMSNMNKNLIHLIQACR